jgi:ribose transport system ATP-binding protein
MPSHPSQPAAVEIVGVSKFFGSTRALHDVTLRAHAGRIHAVTGENGAGKSTLMKLLAGVFQPDAGELRLDGRPLRLRSPADARAAGVSTVFQEPTVLPNLTVAENVLLGHEPQKAAMLDRAAMRSAAVAAMQRVGLNLDPDGPCAALSIAEQQMLEIAKGVSRDARIFIFDEPTAPLNRAEVDALEVLLRQLRASGKVILYISHRLDEVFRFCDDVTVLKDGRWVTTQASASLDADALIACMVGRPMNALFPTFAEKDSAETVLEMRHLRLTANGPAVRFALRRGEIVGLAGLEGQGQREIVRCMAGLRRPAQSDVLKRRRDGTLAPLLPEAGVAAAVVQGVALVPDDRKAEGLFLDLSIHDNLSLGLLRGMALMRLARREPAFIKRIVQRLLIRTRDASLPVATLSGGNQQKVMLGRWLVAGVDTLLIEQPTRGVDVGAKAQIYELLHEYCAEGGTALVVSSELPELIGLCHRIFVIRAGELVAERPAKSCTEEGLLALALERPRCVAERATTVGSPDEA